MQYILSEEEIRNLIPKQNYDYLKEELELVVNIFRSTDFCVMHKFKGKAYCDNCPIASLNINQPTNGKPHWIPCSYQRFSK